jgi:hypothetical protein
MEASFCLFKPSIYAQHEYIWGLINPASRAGTILNCAVAARVPFGIVAERGGYLTPL